MLPYGTGICWYALIQYFYFFIASVPFLILLLKSGLDKSMERSTIPACPSLVCFFLTEEIPKGLILENFVFEVCVCMFCFL